VIHFHAMHYVLLCDASRMHPAGMLVNGRHYCMLAYSSSQLKVSCKYITKCYQEVPTTLCHSCCTVHTTQPQVIVLSQYRQLQASNTVCYHALPVVRQSTCSDSADGLAACRPGRAGWLLTPVKAVLVLWVLPRWLMHCATGWGTHSHASRCLLSALQGLGSVSPLQLTLHGWTISSW
jgi:hypothetical protein